MKSVLVSVLVLCACAAGAGNVCVWSGAAGDGKWSTAGNWENGLAPVSGNGDRVVFISGDSPLTVSNDVANLNLGYVTTSNLNADASVLVTIAGNEFTLSGVAGVTRIACSCATTFDTPITFACDLKAMFMATADFTFNGDLTLNGTGTTTFDGGTTGGKTPSVYFYGRIDGPNALFDAVNNENNAAQYYYHYGPVILRQYNAGMEYRNNYCHFYATGNDIKTLCVVGYGKAYFETANAFAADNKVVQYSTRYSPSIGGQVSFYGDQSFAKWSVDASYGSKRTCINGASTLTLTPGENLSLPTWLVSETMSVRWAPTGDYSLTLSAATNGTSGALLVDRGTLKFGDAVRFTALKKLNLAATAGFEVGSGSENCFGTTPAVVMTMFSTSTVKLDADVKVKNLYIDGVPQPSGTYSAANGDSWITGTGALTVTTTIAGNFWDVAGDGDWNTAANWTLGTPSNTVATYVTKYGDRTISVDAAPEEVAGALTIENLAGTTRLDVNAPLTLRGGCVALMQGAEVSVNEGGEWFQDFTGAASGAGSGTFTLCNGGTFTVNGGLVNLTNTTGRIRIGHEDGSAGTFEVKSGTVIVKKTSGDYIRLCRNGLLKMTGGRFAYSDYSDFLQQGGTIDLSGDALMESTSTAHSTILRTVTLRISGNAEFKDSATGQSRWFFTPNAAGEVCRGELSDNGMLRVSNDSVYLNKGQDGGKTIFTLRGHSKFISGNGFYIGSGTGAEGELDIYDQAYAKQGGYGYGVNIGEGGSVAKPAKGILRMHGGALHIFRTPSTRTSMQGTIVGHGLASSAASPIAQGVFEMTGGVLTNSNNAVVAFGAGMATGTGTQSGGFLYQSSGQPTLFGFRGGTGTYDMSGGRFLAKGSAYIGGAQTNAINYYLSALVDRPGTGRLTVSGGSFETEKALFVSAGGYGTLEVVGTNGAVKVGSDLYLTNSWDAVASKTAPAKLKFTASADGCSAIQVTKKLQIAADAELTVDLTAFTGKKSFPLVTCGTSIEGAFAPAKINIVADHPKIYSIRQDAKRLRLMVQNGTTLFLR